jgi:two-component system chemotaxis response regulator CheB
MDSDNSPSPRPQDGEWLITVAASTGGIAALQTLVASLPQDLPAAVVVLQHRVPQPTESHLEAILGRAATLPVLTATEGQTIERGHVYVPRSDLHLTVTPQKRFSYTNGRRIKHLLASANPLFESAAEAYKDRLLAIVLTGHGSDGTDGVQTVKTHGGLVIAQDPIDAEHKSMPQAAITSGAVDFVLPLESIGQAVNAIVRGRWLQRSVSTN